jgi:flagellin
MGLRINQNIAAQNAYRSLSVSDNQMSKSLEKLSSGSRINRAADDAAGLAISEGLRSQVGGLKVATRNAQDGVSVVQTAEGALNEVHSILQRMRDLGVQAGNDSNNADARANIATEVTSLKDELSRISSSTNFNGTNLLDGTAGGDADGNLKFQVGADGDTNSQITVDLSTANVNKVTAALSDRATFTLDPATITGAQTFAYAGGAAIDDVVVTFGAADAATTGSDVVNTLNNDAGFAAKFKASLDDSGNLVVASKIDGAAAVQGGSGVAAGAAPGAAGLIVAGVSEEGLDFTDATTSQTAIAALDEQISNVSTARAKLGASQNRFEHTINNTNVAIENLSASESRIRDTDMAQEMMSYTRSQILTQAGTAMLSQANQSQQGVLSLLR